MATQGKGHIAYSLKPLAVDINKLKKLPDNTRQ